MTSGDHSRVAALKAALAKPTYLLAVVLAAKLFVVRWVIFSTPDPLRFLITDLSPALLVAAAVEGRRLGRRSTLLVADAVFTTLMAVVLVFHSYFGRLPSLQVLGTAEQLRAVQDSVFSLLRPAFLLLYADLVPLGLLAWRVPAFFDRRVHFRVRGTFVIVGLLIAALQIGTAMVRPNPDFTIGAEERGMVNQEVADWALREFVPPKRAKPIDAQLLQARIDELRTGQPAGEAASVETTGPLAGAGKGLNLIVIVAESMQQFLLDRSVAGQELLPSVDALAAEGYEFEHVFTQVGLGTTADAEFTLNTALMPLEYKPFGAAYGDRAVPSLPKLLKANGYTTMTFHADEITHSSRDKMYPALGFEQVYADRFYGGEDVIGLGASDEVLFGKALPVLERAGKSGKPFYATVLTITSHDPFPLPPGRATLALPGDQAGTRAGRYLATQHYTDAAIGKFIDGLKKAGLYEHSVIVVVGDHFGLQSSAMTADDERVVAGVIGRRYGEVDRMNVPFVVAIPGSGLKGVVDTPGGQVDVLPTLAAVMGLSTKGLVTVGRDLTVPGPSLIGMRYHNPAGTYLDDEVLAIPRGSRGFEAWSIRTGRRLARPPEDVEGKSKRIFEIEQISDGYLANLPRRSVAATKTR